MKTVVAHSASAAIEQDWAKQFAGLDAFVKSQFSTFDWTQRHPKVFTFASATWTDIVKAVSDAAAAAGAGGVVVIATGHGGAVPNDVDGGLINWDSTDSDVAMDWDQNIRKGVFWDHEITIYTDKIPFGKPPTRKDKGWEKAKKRHDAFDALMQIGSALKSNGVARLTFTVCTAGKATAYMDRLATLMGVNVACFKEKTRVFDDGTLKLNPGKARLILDRDATRPASPTLTDTTNSMDARIFSPSLDDTSIAYVGKPKAAPKPAPKP
jgi:hypothetical protein